LFSEDNVDPVNLRGRLRTKPLVSAVQGICFTLGIELMLASDIVVAASDCRFAQIEVKRGIMPSAGATIRMTERAGLGNALRYLLTGDEFNAETALRLGFVQEVVAPGSERQRAIKIATLISEHAPLAIAATLANARKAVFEGPNVAAAQLQKTRRKASAVSSKSDRLNSWGADVSFRRRTVSNAKHDLCHCLPSREHLQSRGSRSEGTSGRRERRFVPLRPILPMFQIPSIFVGIALRLCSS
jgi:enoyl-CoA hydratase